MTLKLLPLMKRPMMTLEVHRSEKQYQRLHERFGNKFSGAVLTEAETKTKVTINMAPLRVCGDRCAEKLVGGFWSSWTTLSVTLTWLMPK
jgi:hypothetical protein